MPMSSIGVDQEESRRLKKIGLALIIGPAPALVFIMGLWGVALYYADLGQISPVTLNIFNWILGLLALAAVILLNFGPLVGFRIFGRIRLQTSDAYDKRSGAGKNSEVPPEIKGWNWGAAGLAPVWGAYHGEWVGLLAYIPYVNIILFFVLGKTGSELAWRKHKWESVADFLAVQKKWRPWGIFFSVIYLMIFLFYFILYSLAG